MKEVTFPKGKTHAFRKWVAANPDGFVVNWLQNGKLIVLHSARCGALQVKNIKGEKVCADKATLSQWCLFRFKRKPDPCGLCNP